MEEERDELATKLSDMTRAEEVIREKISEKQAEQEAKQAEMEEFQEIKVQKIWFPILNFFQGKLEEIIERLGLENEEIQAIKEKIEEELVSFPWKRFSKIFRCEAIGAENASLAAIIEAAEGKAAERDALNEQKEELDIQKTELQSK